MDRISNRVNSLAASATLIMAQKSRELRESGIDVINMSIGEPDFNTPDYIKEAAKRAIDDNFSHYPPVAGFLSLREAICRKLKEENGLDYTADQIVVGNGAKQELANAVLALVNPGDEVIIPTPAWVSYMEMVKLAGGVIVEVAAGLDKNFKITPQQLEGAITPRTRLVMFNSPGNPSGSVYSHDELKALAGVLSKCPKVAVMADDIYEHISYVGMPTSLAQFPELKDQVIIINGVSKAYAMTGWRIGWMAAPKDIAKAVTKLQGQYTSGVSTISQKAAEAALTGPQEAREEMRRAFERRRDLVVNLAREIPGWRSNVPEGAFYLFPEVKSLIGKRFGDKEIGSSGDYTMYLLERAHVACVDGAAFAMPGYIRLSYATSDEEIREAFRRIKEATEALE